jgi:hypothetical protein
MQHANALLLRAASTVHKRVALARGSFFETGDREMREMKEFFSRAELAY